MGPCRTLAGAWALCGTLACGAPVEDAEAPRTASSTVTPAAATPVATAAIDPLLAQARAAIAVAADGAVLDEGVRARVMASDAPQHGHAQRLLAALAHEGAAAVAPVQAGAAMPSVPPLAPSATGDDDVPPVVPPAGAASGGTASGGTASGGTASGRSSGAATSGAGTGTGAGTGAGTGGAVQIERLGMAKRKGGASLTIVASRGILVGIVSQPEGGLVRLMLDDVKASSKVMSSRPRVAGAAVTDIARSSSGVRVTIALEPGWTLDGVHRTSGGARVDLRAP